MSTQPTPNAVRELVLASAGSGKTYRISSRLIGLLASGEEPRSLLASTFTRKAAGEILQRVLVRLARAAMDKGAAEALATDTLPPERASDGNRAFWTDLLRRTVSELHRLHVGTLDAFFVRATQSFAHDLGLPSRWCIADTPTAERIRAEALDRVLGRDSSGFVEVLRDLHAGSVRRSVHEVLAGAIDAMLVVHSSLEPGSPGWGALRAVVGHAPEELRGRAADVATCLADVPIPTNAKGTQPDSRWQKAVVALADALTNGDWDSIVTGGLGKPVLDAQDSGEPSYYKKSFPSELLAATTEAVEIARGAIRSDVASRAESMGRIADQYEEAFRAGLLAAGSLRFEDVTSFLLRGNALGSRDALAYRLDSATKHLLLDEFQDTSILQWQALLPLVDTLVTHGDGSGAVVVVADPKQSIYGWRGAAPVVVRAFGDRYGLPVETMTRSWRSSRVVLDAVNRVFDRIEEVSSLAGKDPDPETARSWGEAFERHEAIHRDLPGHVLMMAGPPKVGRQNRQPEFSRFAARHIADLHRRAPLRSIGVLTRSNDEVARLIFELGRLDVPASEEGGTTLLDSAAVVSLLALLRLVDHPGDGLARYHVAMTPVGEAVELTDWKVPKRAHSVARAWRRRLMEDGYGRTLASLARDLRDALGERDRMRVLRLVELGYAWDASSAGSGLRVDDFVRRAETERAESPGENQVRVMTVHGSKGLEFDTVVLPQLHLPLTGRSDTGPLGFRSEGAGSCTHAFPYVKEAWLPLFKDVPELAGAAGQRQADRLRDALGVLYVGMTRARHALHLLVPSDGDGKVSEARTPARILRERLCSRPVTDVVGQGEVLFEAGRNDWMDDLPAPVRRPVTASISAPGEIRLLRDTPRARGLDRKTPSAPSTSEQVDVAALLGIGRSAGALERGSIVHAWLETLEWLETGLAAEEVLLAVARRLAPAWSDAETGQTLGGLRRALAAPAVAEALSRSSWPAGAQVERELPFLVRDRDTLVEGVIDRLVLIPGTDGAIAEAVVIDFKTDRPGDDPDRDARREQHYREQMRIYARAVRSLYGLAPERVRAILLYLDSGRAVEVGREAKA